MIIFLILDYSFKFCPEIAYVASCILDILNSLKGVRIVGEGKPGWFKEAAFEVSSE